MVAISQTIFSASCWLAQPVTIPARWFCKIVSYYLGFQEKNLPYSEAVQRMSKEVTVWHHYRQNYQRSEMWDKIRQQLFPPPLPPELLPFIPQAMRPPTYSWRTGDRKEFWGVFVQQQLRQGFSKPNPLLTQAFQNFEREGKSPGLAIDFGCGAGGGTSELLARGWQVIAVDSSQVALEALKEQIQKQFEKSPLPEGQLKLVCAEMETYQFPKNVRLIYGNSFPYCDPESFPLIWQRAYQALEKGGRIVGELFPFPGPPAEEVFRLMGAWFTDTQVARAFLDHIGYHREVCEIDKYWYEAGVRTINFMGQKPEVQNT